MRTRSPRLLILALVSVPGACSQQDDAVAARVRILDRLEGATIESAVRLERDAGVESLPERAFQERITASGDDLLGPHGAVLASNGDAGVRGGTLRAGDRLVRAFPAAGGSIVRLRVDAIGDVRARAFQCAELPGADRLAEPGALSDLLEERNTHEHAFRDRTATFSTRFTSAAVLVVVEALDDDARVRSIEKSRLAPDWTRILRSVDALGHPHARRVAVGRDHREALVLHTPARLSIEIAISGRAELRFAAATLAGARAAVQVRARRDGHERTERVELPSDGASGWREVAVEIPGARGPVELEWRAESGGPGAWVAIAHPALCPVPPPPLAKPDVVIVSLDTVRADRLSIYGAPADTCPNLAAMAPDSRVFDRAVAPAPWTLPSHASLFTGQFPERHGVDLPERSLDPKRAPLLARAFRAHGYRTAAFTGGGFVRPEFGFAAGFERYTTVDPASSDPASGALDEWLAEPPSAPRFAFVHTYAAHGFEASQSDLEAVGATPADLARAEKLLSLPPAALLAAVENLREDPAARALAERLYDASLRAADRVLGRVVEALLESGRYEDTILVVLSDHGQELFDHGWIGHGRTLFEEQLRVPLVWRGPGIESGRSDQVVSLVDVAPTLRELAGLPPGDADGRSLATLLRGGHLPPRPALASRRDRGDYAHAIRSGPLKLILRRTPDGGERSDVYDLARDPAERAPQAADSGAAEIERHLRAWLENLRAAGSSARDHALDDDVTRELRELGYLGG